MTLSQKMRALKERSNMTSQQISDLSGVPLSTVNRILSGQTDNPSFITISEMVKAMGGSLDDLCDDGAETREEHKNTENDYEQLITLYQKIVKNKNRWIRTLFWVCIGLTAIIAFLLILDCLSPGFGLIRY